jgi:hypothetical protein
MRNESHWLDKMDEYEKWLIKLMHFDESKNGGWCSLKTLTMIKLMQ